MDKPDKWDNEKQEVLEAMNTIIKHGSDALKYAKTTIGFIREDGYTMTQEEYDSLESDILMLKNIVLPVQKRFLLECGQFDISLKEDLLEIAEMCRTSVAAYLVG